jgi:hypothetical protein
LSPCVDVVWVSLRSETPCRGYWDQAIVERLFTRRWGVPGWPKFVHHDSFAEVPDGSGAVVVIPARHHVDQVAELNVELAQLAWALVILTGDEEGVFPVERITHPNLRLWVQTPQPERIYPEHTRWLPNGPTPQAYEQAWADRTRDVVFAGQVTHTRREECVTAVQRLLNLGCTGALHPSTGFTQGLPPAEYLHLMATARVCPAPSGPVHVDSFRAWEAFELGAIPVLDTLTPAGESSPYWPVVMADPTLPAPPAWLIADWTAALPEIIDDMIADWPVRGTRCAAWWLGFQRQLARRLADDLMALTGHPLAGTSPDDLITVLIPTSPIPSHPSPAVIAETIASVRAQLPHAEILIMCDRPNPTAEHRRDAYDAYVYELTRLCREQWTGVLPVVFDEHLHQSGMTSRALDMVTTPLILFVEHDTPIYGRIDWPGLTAAVTSGDAGVIRLHHEAIIHPEHAHLMLGGPSPVGPAGVSLIPTQQWSQRPHLADTSLYRMLLAEHLAGRRMMVEDVMHGVVQDHWGSYGMAGWRRWRLHIYAPDDTTEHGLKRSWHTDGRGTDPKWTGH